MPFLDYRLVEFIESLPPQLKLHGMTGKYLHKKAMLKWLSRDVVYRKKKGFAHPIAQWLRTSMRPLVEDCPAEQGFIRGDLFRPGLHPADPGSRPAGQGALHEAHLSAVFLGAVASRVLPEVTCGFSRCPVYAGGRPVPVPGAAAVGSSAAPDWAS